jgi:hypothetical protein
VLTTLILCQSAQVRLRDQNTAERELRQENSHPKGPLLLGSGFLRFSGTRKKFAANPSNIYFLDTSPVSTPACWTSESLVTTNKTVLRQRIRIQTMALRDSYPPT